MQMAKVFLVLGGLNAMLGVMFGAAAAHGLRSSLPQDMLSAFQTGVHYHMYHALGLVVIGALLLHVPGSTGLKWAGGLMFAGILLFSGSLYLLALTQIRWLGAVTPFGGVAFIVAWLLLVIAVVRL